MLLNCGVGEDSWESLGLQGNPTCPSWRRSVLRVHWKDWCWSWNSNTLATWCEELTHLKRPWCWERLRAGGEGDNRGWDGWMVSPTQWTWVWVNSGSWRWTRRPGVMQSMELQRVGDNWVTELSTSRSKLYWGARYFKISLVFLFSFWEMSILSHPRLRTVYSLSIVHLRPPSGKSVADTLGCLKNSHFFLFPW